MSGVLWATASGIGFGVFQSLNRRAIRGIEDPYVSTFLQLAVATAILVVASLVSEDLSQLGDATGEAIALFALAGVIHFVLGWLLLNVSQARIGASRTAPLITLTPLFGIVLAAADAGRAAERRPRSPRSRRSWSGRGCWRAAAAAAWRSSATRSSPSAPHSCGR